MKSRKSSTAFLWAIVLICCYQEIWAGVVVKQVGKQNKNSTHVAKEQPLASTTKHPKVMHKAKTTTQATTTTTTTTSTTTLKPEVETIKPLDIDLDGRSAYINNQFVEDETSMPDNSPPLYEILQQQMETVLSNTGNNMEIYADSPQMKEMPNDEDDKQKPPGKPLFSFDMNQFDEYEDDDSDQGDEDATYTEEQPENCEDTEESLTDDAFGYVGQPAVANYPNPQENNYQQSAQNPPNSIYDLLNTPQPLQNKPSNNPYDSSNYPSSTNSNQEESSYNNYGQQTNKPIPHNPPNTNQNSYGQSNPSDNPSAIQKPSKKPAAQNTHGQSKPKPSSSNNNQQSLPGNYGSNQPAQQSSTSPHYGQTKPLDQQYNQSNKKPSSTQNAYVKSKQQQSSKPQHQSSKSPQNSQKPNNKLSTNPTSHHQAYKPNNMKPVQNIQNNNIGQSGSSLTPSVLNSSYGNTPSSSNPSNINSNSYSASSTNPLNVNSNSYSASSTNPSNINSNSYLASSTNPSNVNSNPYSSPSAAESSYGNSNSAISFSNPTYGNSNMATPSSPATRPIYDNSYTSSNTNVTTSNPASLSPFSSTSGNMKFPSNDRKRPLRFRTVSSSTQFVSTPLADLMFKFSIGMAKPSSSSSNGIANQAQIYDINDIEK